MLVLLGLVPWSEATAAIGKGADVYMCLLGMMLLSELARREGLFDYLAATCVRTARGSANRLLLLVHGVGTLVTIFMSNDATAVVLTPAVLAVSRKAKAESLPYLIVCAFIANAASFVLPISNPANLVIFGQHLPSLAEWVWRFSVPSMLAVYATYWVVKVLFRSDLAHEVAADIEVPLLSAPGRFAAAGVVLTVGVLLGASDLGMPLGLPTLLAASSACAVLLIYKWESPWHVIKCVSWSALALVAGLFVLVEGLQRAGVLNAVTDLQGRRDLNSRRSTGCGSGNRLRVQPHEQFASGLDRWLGRDRRWRYPSHSKRYRDWRRPRLQPFRDGLTRDHPVAGRNTTRGGKRQRLAVPESWGRRYACRASPGAAATDGNCTLILDKHVTKTRKLGVQRIKQVTAATES